MIKGKYQSPIIQGSGIRDEVYLLRCWAEIPGTVRLIHRLFNGKFTSLDRNLLLKTLYIVIFFSNFPTMLKKKVTRSFTDGVRSSNMMPGLKVKSPTLYAMAMGQVDHLPEGKGQVDHLPEGRGQLRGDSPTAQGSPARLAKTWVRRCSLLRYRGRDLLCGGSSPGRLSRARLDTNAVPHVWDVVAGGDGSVDDISPDLAGVSLH